MTDRARVLELLADSGGRLLVLDDERADRVVLVGARRVRCLRTTLHRLADAGHVDWRHAVVLDPKRPHAPCDDTCTGNERGHGPPTDEVHCCPGHLHGHRCRLAPCP